MPSALRSRLTLAGLALLVLGTGPLFVIMVGARLGLIGDDPNPNPILPGMLAGLTFWPAVALIVWGAWRTHRSHSGETIRPEESR